MVSVPPLLLLPPVFPRRYVTPGAFVESALFAGLGEDDIKEWNMLARVRYAVYRPGGPMAMELSKNPTVLLVNDTAFVHGGLTAVHGEHSPPLLSHNDSHLNGERHQSGASPSES